MFLQKGIWAETYICLAGGKEGLSLGVILSYSLGKAREGNCLVGAGWTGGAVFRRWGRIFAACISFSRCWNLFRSLSTCFWVFSCMAKESVKACSSARNRSSPAVGTLGYVGSMVVTGLRREPEQRNSWSRRGSEEYSSSDNCWKGNQSHMESVL